MLKPRQLLPDEDHLMRVVPYKKQRRDGDDNLLGFNAQAFEHRVGEDYLSKNWLEYFRGTHAANVADCIAAVKACRDTGTKTRFGVANVAAVKRLAQHNTKRVRIVYAPSRDNASHAAVYIDLPALPTVYEALALEFFKEHY